MRTWTIYFSMLFLLCFCAGCTTAGPEKTGSADQVSITPTHAVYAVHLFDCQKRNDSVGSEWNVAYFCDGKQIESGAQWVVPLYTTKSVTIDIVITERDDWNDVGRGSITLSLQEDNQATVQIIVTENKGRFRGNQAEWEITGRVALLEKRVGASTS